MKEKVEQLKFTALVGIIVQIAIFAIYIFVNGTVTSSMYILILFLVIEGAIVFYLLSVYEKELNKEIVTVSEILGSESQEAFSIGGLGLVVYDSDYTIIWMSDYFDELNIKQKNEKVTRWLPTTVGLFNGDVDVVNVQYNEYVFRVTRNSKARLLYFEDITTEYIITEKYTDESPVMGLVHLDNYQEYTQYEEESRVYYIDSIVKQNLLNWASGLGIFIRRLRNDRYLLLTNNKTFEEIQQSNFSIMHKIRKEAQNNDLVLSLSMGFALGSSNYLELEEMTNSLLELAQSRGGDQVAVKTVGEDIKYYGGNSQSRERRSKARVRVISQTIRDQIMESDKVIIVGHRNADFDCVGAALTVSKIVSAQNKTPYVVLKTGGVEDKLMNAIESNYDVLSKDHNFISEDEAIDLLTYETLVILVDHHSDKVSSSPMLIDRANRICIIDHHRRTTDYNFQPILAYIESAASSTGELVVELLPYQEKRVNLSPLEATFVYTGIVVDTNGFINRVGSRTFESASMLQRYGADVRYANEMLDDSFEDLMLKNKILEAAVMKEDSGIIVAPVYDGTIIPRGLISNAADELLSIQQAKAVFVISAISEEKVGISARSRGSFNVQKIMEAMGGGGHFNAAAVQLEDINVAQLYTELEEHVESYLEEVYNDESNIT